MFGAVREPPNFENNLIRLIVVANPRSVSIGQMITQLIDLGVKPGGVLLVHTAFSQVGPVENGPAGLIAALESVVLPHGTLVMPGMSYNDDAVFDPAQSPCMDMGIVADTFWRLPDVLRSNSPHSFSASGRLAGYITAPHPPDNPHGLNSPVGRVYDLNGQILLLGVGHDANTTIHLAESLGGVRYRRPHYVTILQDGEPIRLDYQEIDHCCENFNRVDGWLDAQNLQRRGNVGHAEARLMDARAVVEVVLEQIRQNETVFLHPPGVDEDCDEARASMADV